MSFFKKKTHTHTQKVNYLHIKVKFNLSISFNMLHQINRHENYVCLNKLSEFYVEFILV